MAPFYITTAIDYANGDPHIGHAFEKIGADAIARYHRLRGDAVWFLVGMDEHGQKVAQTASELALTPQQLADRVTERFQRMWERLAISYDQFIRTTGAEHQSGVRRFIDAILERRPDDFYERSYSGWYCVGCEAFKTDAEIEGGRCVLHPGRTLEWVEERNWFFRLTRYREFLLDRLTSSREDAERSLSTDAPKLLVRPESRFNEVRALLAGGLEDVSATRSRFAWGVPFPRPTSDGEIQTTYVWFDALPNYWTATQVTGPHGQWPAQLHVIGKDITRFHCVIWPAMLAAAGYELPREVFAHGFVGLGGERFSKSAGVTLDLGEAVDRFGADAFRYFLLREVPFDGDGSFSWERFEERYTADMANAFGNLASRTIAMVEKYRDGIVPSCDGVSARAGAAPPWLREGEREYLAAMDTERLQDAIAAVWRVVARANEYVDRQAPWKLARDAARDQELDETLATLVLVLAWLAVCLYPIMPGRAEALWTQLGAPGELARTRALHADEGHRTALAPGGWRVRRGAPLFPKEEVRQVPTEER